MTYKTFRVDGRLFILLLLTFTQACNKFVAVDPPITSITGESVYTSDATAISVITNIYALMSQNGVAQGSGSISVDAGLSADELQGTTVTLGTNLAPFFQNNLSNTSALNWDKLYNYLYTTNAVLAGVDASTSLTAAVKTQLLGEAYFMRAFLYFYLVNQYGDVPLITVTNYQTNAVLARAPKALVWQQIIADLKNAQDLLSNAYLDGTLLSPTVERVRPTSWSATALLSRCYLYTEKWDSAEAQATAVINNSSLFALDSLNQVFLANSTEAIWQLQPVDANVNTWDGNFFIIVDSSLESNQVYINTPLMNAFELGDNRRVDWIDSVTNSGSIYYFPYKYKVATSANVSEYLMVFRLAEQYLIRAEARAEQNNLMGAQSDLDVVRNRAGLGNTSATQANILNAISHERQVELFTEWGNRWFDLKRMGTIDSVMNVVTPQKGGVWTANAALYPVPLDDLQADPSLVQNPGY